MKNEKLQEINELFTKLIKFRDDCNISPKSHEDLKHYWIIDKHEANLIKLVLELLADCGATRV